MPTTGGAKTWNQWMVELGETFRKWPYGPGHGQARDPQLFVLWDDDAAGRRRAMRATADLDARRVTLQFYWMAPDDSEWRRIRISTDKRDRAVDNLAALAKTMEWLRLTEVRGLSNLSIGMIRQMYPQPATSATTSQGASQPRAPFSTGHYAVLHVTNDAPLAVAEAAYRAAARELHPDVAGTNSLRQMQALNAAIEAIRAERVPKSATQQR